MKKISFTVTVELVPNSLDANVLVETIENPSPHDDLPDRLDDSSAKLEYLRRHLGNELNAVTHQFLIREWLVFQAFRTADDIGARAANFVIEDILKRTHTRLRARLPTKRGRPRSQRLHTFIDDKMQFAEKCFVAFEVIQKRGEKLSLTNLANELNSSNVSNKEKATRYQMKKFGLTLGELIGSFSGKGQDRVSSVKEMLARFDEYLNYKHF